MSHLLFKAIRGKIAKLEQLESDVKGRLSTETAVIWGEEFVQRKLTLLRELELIRNNLSRLKQQMRDIGTALTRTRSYTVEVNGTEVTYTVVPSSELTAPENKVISIHAPLAQALKRAKVGETVQVTSPIGDKMYKLLSVKQFKAIAR